MKQTFNLTGRLRVHVYVKVRDNPKIFCQHVDRWLWISTLNSLRPTKKIMRRLFAGSSTLTSMSSKKMAGFYYSKLLYKLRSCDQRLVSNFWHYARQNIAQSLTISTTSVMTSLVDGRWDRATAHATANTHASNVTSCVHLCAPHDTPPVLRSVHHIVSRHRHSPWRHVSAVIKLGMSSNQVWFEICTHELCLQ